MYSTLLAIGVMLIGFTGCMCAFKNMEITTDEIMNYYNDDDDEFDPILFPRQLYPRRYRNRTRMHEGSYPDHSFYASL
jgi:hypothetical protein